MNPEYHPKISGRRGAIVNKFRSTQGVQISCPKQDVYREQSIDERVHCHFIGFKRRRIRDIKEMFNAEKQFPPPGV